MTFTEIVVVVGGLALGYWTVAVLLPALGGKSDEPHGSDADADADAAVRTEEAEVRGNREDVVGRDAAGPGAGPADPPPVRRRL